MNRHVWELIRRDVLTALLTAMPMVMLVKMLAGRLAESSRPSGIFLANPSSWVQDVVRSEMSKRGVPTASYTHGMVETAMAYRSRTGFLFALGVFDCRLLRRFGVRSSLIPVGPALTMGTRSQVTTRPRRPPNKVLLLTSFIWAAGLHRRFDFISTTLEFLQGRREAESIETIVVKLHPFESLEGLKTETEAFSRRFPDLAGRIGFQVDDLEGAFEGADLVFAMPSTTILDCLRRDIPFFMYDTRDFDRNTFYGHLPAHVVYRTVADLETAYDRRLQDRTLNQKIAESYYGPKESQAEGLSRLSAFLRGRHCADVIEANRS